MLSYKALTHVESFYYNAFIKKAFGLLVLLILLSMMSHVFAKQSALDSKNEISSEQSKANFEDQMSLIDDIDGDGLSNTLEEKLGTEQFLADTDGDGLNDAVEVGNKFSKPLNSDNDALINALDADDDNDGLPTILEISAKNNDVDNDGVLNHLDQDSDNDGVNDGIEAGMIGKDLDHDKVDDAFDSENAGAEDKNGDGINDVYILPDINKNGIADLWEKDYQNDSTLASNKRIQDNAHKYAKVKNQKENKEALVIKVKDVERTVKTAVVLQSNVELTKENDTDNDGLLNAHEIALKLDPNKRDTDGDKVSDAIEIGLDINNPQDSDLDGVIDALDPDDDGDGVLTKLEDLNKDGSPINDDTDLDGVPNFLDANDDGDNKLTKDEASNFDSDKDGILDYLDKNDGAIDYAQTENKVQKRTDPEIVVIYEDKPFKGVNDTPKNSNTVISKKIDFEGKKESPKGVSELMAESAIKEPVNTTNNTQNKAKTGVISWLTSLLPD